MGVLERSRLSCPAYTLGLFKKKKKPRDIDFWHLEAKSPVRWSQGAFFRLAPVNSGL